MGSHNLGLLDEIGQKSFSKAFFTGMISLSRWTKGLISLGLPWTTILRLGEAAKYTFGDWAAKALATLTIKEFLGEVILVLERGFCMGL